MLDSERRRLKAERLAARFQEEMGVGKAAIRAVEAAKTWHLLRSMNCFDRRLIAAELALYDATEEIKRIEREAMIVAQEWAQTDQEPPSASDKDA